MAVALVPLLGGCMAHGLAHAGATGGTGPGSGPAASLQYAEASSGGLTITLSFPTPSIGAVVPVDARWTSLGDSARPIGGDVWLRVRTPTGRVDRLSMRHLDSSSGAYQATYGFQLEGSYLVTADGRAETGGTCERLR